MSYTGIRTRGFILERALGIGSGDLVKFRSAEWFYGRDELGFQHRSALRSMGIDVERFKDRPVIGIANSPQKKFYWRILVRQHWLLVWTAPVQI